jgi:hypothetical protein
VITIIPYSSQVPRLSAATMPTGSPTTMASSSAATDSSIVGAKFSNSSLPTSPPVRIERPSWNVTTRPTNSTY